MYVFPDSFFSLCTNVIHYTICWIFSVARALLSSRILSYVWFRCVLSRRDSSRDPRLFSVMYVYSVTYGFCSCVRLSPCGRPRDLYSCSRDWSRCFRSPDPDRSFRHPKWLTMSLLFAFAVRRSFVPLVLSAVLFCVHSS